MKWKQSKFIYTLRIKEKNIKPRKSSEGSRNSLRKLEVIGRSWF